MKLCNVHLQCNVAQAGDETMAVSPAVSISVIGLIIDASIPAGAGHAARDTAGGGEERGGDRNGGRRANKRRHLECCSCSGLPQDDTCSVNCVSYTHTHTHTIAVLECLSCRLLTYIDCS